MNGPKVTIDRGAPYFTIQQWNDKGCGKCPASQVIPSRAIVEYLGHIPGGMVKVRWLGECVIHPGSTMELVESMKK